jgi:hypothetical protein
MNLDNLDLFNLIFYKNWYNFNWDYYVVIIVDLWLILFEQWNNHQYFNKFDIFDMNFK